MEHVGLSVSGLAAATLDLLPQSVYIVDRNLTVVAWNSGREQGPLGLSRVRALGRNLREVLSPRGLDSVMPAFRHVIETGTPFEEKRASRDGRRAYRVRRMPINGAGSVTHVVTLSDEIPRSALREAVPSRGPRRLLRGVRTAFRRLLPRRPPAAVVLAPPARDLALNGIIPVCAWCKKIRDQHGDWHQVEAYLATRSDATFTHGICQDCSGRAYLAAGHDGGVAGRPNGRPRHPTAP